MSFAVALAFVVGFICFAVGMLCGFVTYARTRPLADSLPTDDLRRI